MPFDSRSRAGGRLASRIEHNFVLMQTELTALLLVRASIAYRQLAERALTLSQLGTTIRLCQNAVLCACSFGLMAFTNADL